MPDRGFHGQGRKAWPGGGHRERGQKKGRREALQGRCWGRPPTPNCRRPIGKPMATASGAENLAVMLRPIDPVALQGVRKKDGLVSVYDVLQLLTGHELTVCRKTWQRLLETHPELAAICRQLRFSDKGRGSHQQTPATDARGVVHIVMALPGSAASLFRMQAADVLVRYLGGDPELVTEVCFNRRAQETLAREQPGHFARVFGEAVEAAAPVEAAVEMQAVAEDLENELLLARIARERAHTTALIAQARKDDAEAKRAHLQNVELAMQVGQAQGFGNNWRYQELARAAVNAAMLPPGESPDGTLDAAEYLKLRGHTPEQIGRMSPEFGKALKAARLKVRGEPAPTATQDYGSDGRIEREVYQYARQADREFLAAVYDEFKENHCTYRKVMQPDTAMRGQVRAALEGGRGMPKPKRGCVRPTPQ